MSGRSKNSPSWSEFEKAFFAARWGISQDSDGWEVYGFSLDEAIEWASLDVEPGDANRYRESGVPNPPDENFSFNGIEIEEAIQWVKEGFKDFNDAAEWIAWGVSPKDASKYIDAGKKLPEDEFRFEGLVLEEAIQWVKEGFEYFDDAAEWIAWGVSPKDAKKYKDAGKELPDENFRDEGLTLEETFKWFDEGFEDFYVAAEWIAWKVSPKAAKKYRDAGKEPPDYEFRDEGLSFTNAMKWQEHGFHTSEYDNPQSEDENYWKNWHDTGFKPIEAASMRAKLFEYIKEQFEAGTRVRERQYRFGVSKETELTRFTSQCCQSLMQLAAAGMKIDVENLVKWRGFSSEMIIATIDNGLEPDDADLARVLDIHPNQLELFEKVKAVEDILMDSNYAKFLLNAGITEKQFQYLLKKGFRLTRIADAIKIHSLTINTIIKWAKAGWPVDVLEKDKNGHQQSVLGPWIETKLDPGTAYLWKMNDFSADDYEKWIKAGVTDPEIANRRKVAGIEPKS